VNVYNKKSLGTNASKSLNMPEALFVEEDILVYPS
jgi:hypothetical protein